MRISSVSENESYLYLTLKNNTSKTAQDVYSNEEELSSLMETQTVEEENDKEQYSAAEHMAMMQSLKMIPEYAVSEKEEQAEAGDISSIDADGDGTLSTDEYEAMISQMGIPNALDAEEFFKQFDLNEDGEISADEMPEPGTISKGMDTTEDVTETQQATEYFNNRLLMGLQNYEKNYESMFETLEGTKVNGLA